MSRDLAGLRAGDVAPYLARPWRRGGGRAGARPSRLASLASRLTTLRRGAPGTSRPTVARPFRVSSGRLSNRCSPSPLTFTFLLSFLLVLPASAKFINAVGTLTDDSTGIKARTRIALAIAAADQLAAELSSADAAVRNPAWTRFYGTKAAEDALAAADEVRDALAALRDGWDALSVQTLSIKAGWNSFYVYVNDPAPAAAVICPSGYAARLRARVAESFADPAETGVADLLGRLEALAADYVAIRTSILASFNSTLALDWPMTEVYCYMGSTDAAAQFSTDSSAEASAANPYAIWSAAAPDAVNLAMLPAGFTYAAFSTASSSKTVALLGTGVTSGSMSWRKSGGSDNPAEWNRLGIVTDRSRMNTDAVLKDLDFSNTGVAKMTGNELSNVTFSVAAPGKSLTVADGEVLIANASSTSSWYPAPVVSPSDGVTVAADETVGTFQLKNATASAQVVTGRLFRTGITGSALLAVNAIHVQASSVRSWEIWHFDGEAPTNTVFADELAAGETRTYLVRIPRTAFDLAGLYSGYGDGFSRFFSAVMRFSYGSNGACTYLSLAGESSQGGVATPWPTGLWVGTMTFDKVVQVKGSRTVVNDVPSGGRMRVRGIVHVGTNGVARLLHHVAIESTTVTNAAGETVVRSTLYAGKAKPAASVSSTTSIQRLDSIAMDIDNPVVTGEGAFTNALRFAWTVAPKGRANPFRHPYHPEHDGLTADYEKDAPDGDDMNNYRNSTVKPETWSIFNTLELAVTEANEEELSPTVSGTCVWTLGNMRRKTNGQDLKACGTFTLKRVQSVGTLVE